MVGTDPTVKGVNIIVTRYKLFTLRRVFHGPTYEHSGVYQTVYGTYTSVQGTYLKL